MLRILSKALTHPPRFSFPSEKNGGQKKKTDRKKGGDADFKTCHFLTPILFSDADIDCVSCADFFRIYLGILNE